MNRKYRFTNHAKKRFQERCSELVKDNNVTLSIAKEISKSKPKRAHLNNTLLMTNLYEKYGYDKPFEVLTSDDVVFICRDDSLVTLYPVKDSIFQHNRNKFRK